MLQSRLLLALLAAAASACTAAGTDDSAGHIEAPIVAETGVEPSAVTEPASAVSDTQVVPAAHRTETPAAVDVEVAEDAADVVGARRSAEELALWNEPAFRRWFTESYLAETEIEPRVTLGEREVLEEVFDLIAAERMAEAEELLRDEGGDATSAAFEFTLGNVCLQQERFSEAAAAYAVAVDKHPKFRRAWKNLGLAYLRLDDFERALPALTKALEHGANDAITYGLVGFAYSAVENELAAESAYRMAILLDPATPDFQVGLTRSLFRQGRFADVAALCETLIAANPDNADLWLLQANAFLGLEEPLRAAENFALVERLGSSTTESMNVLGDIYVNAELYDLAVDAYARAMELDSAGGTKLGLRAAKVLASRAALDGARELIERIEARQGDALDTATKQELLRLRARIALADGAGEEEARILEQLVELDPLDGEALILLGQYHYRSGESEQAIFWFERAGNLEGFEADAKRGQAQVLVRQSRYAEALPLLRRAQLIDPRESVQAFMEDVERNAKAR